MPSIDRLTYAIGDIHGYDDLFERMIARIRSDAESLNETPRIVLLGDYIDRGPASRQVLERVGRLLAAPWCDAVALMGNHEEALLRFLAAPDFGETWREWGGGATCAAYGVTMPYMANSADIWHDTRDALARAIEPAQLAIAALPAGVPFRLAATCSSMPASIPTKRWQRRGPRPSCTFAAVSCARRKPATMSSSTAIRRRPSRKTCRGASASTPASISPAC
ncbi:MAG: metallophosphoesterase [Asticcacaulis sp.]